MYSNNNVANDHEIREGSNSSKYKMLVFLYEEKAVRINIESSSKI